MDKKYWRISYKGMGIYEALKKEIWDTSEVPKKEWESFRASGGVGWLNAPDVYSRDSFSYFTDLGYNLFMERTYPIVVKRLDEKWILIEEFTFDEEKINVVYSDAHQIVIER